MARAKSIGIRETLTSGEKVSKPLDSSAWGGLRCLLFRGSLRPPLSRASAFSSFERRFSSVSQLRAFYSIVQARELTQSALLGSGPFADG